MKYINTKALMTGIFTKKLLKPLVTKFIEKVLWKWSDHMSEYSQHAIIEECLK